jgi:hypothetical protein
MDPKIDPCVEKLHWDRRLHLVIRSINLKISFFMKIVPRFLLRSRSAADYKCSLNFFGAYFESNLWFSNSTKFSQSLWEIYLNGESIIICDFFPTSLIFFKFSNKQFTCAKIQESNTTTPPPKNNKIVP